MGRTKRVIMYFYSFGVETSTKLKVLKEDETTIILDEWGKDDKGNEGYRQFDKKSGRCINDLTFLGARRYIKPLLK
jgi:hypothetical protein